MLSFIRYLIRGYKWSLIGVVLLGFGMISCSLLFVYLSKCVIDIAVGVRQGDIYLYVFLLVASIGAQTLFKLSNISLTNFVAVRMGNTVRLRIFSHLLYVRWQSLKTMHSGDMLTRLMRDTDSVVLLLTRSLPSAIISLTQLLASLGLLYYFSPSLAIMLGIGMPLLLAFSKVFFKKMLTYSEWIKKTESKIYSQMQESLSNQAVIRTFERQEIEVNRLNLIQIQLFNTIRKRVGLTVIANLISQAAFSGGYMIAFLWSVYGLKNKLITFGTMTSFLQLVVRIQRPMSDLMSLLPSIISSKASLDRLVDLLAYKTEEKSTKKVLSDIESLKAENISFRYEDGNEWIYKNFSFEIKAGSMVALMGETGSGKTTLLKLFLGLHKVTEGKLILNLRHRKDSVPISEGTRTNFVYVPQGNSLFSGTVRENLLVGNIDASEHELQKVLTIAAADFVWKLPQGLDTLLGEKGNGLSEGQAQRIAIARSLLRPGKILLLDEATSALDEETQRRFVQNLRTNIEGRIVLFITHHSEVASLCDKTVHL